MDPAPIMMHLLGHVKIYLQNLINKSRFWQHATPQIASKTSCCDSRTRRDIGKVIAPNDVDSFHSIWYQRCVGFYARNAERSWFRVFRGIAFFIFKSSGSGGMINKLSSSLSTPFSKFITFWRMVDKSYLAARKASLMARLMDPY